MCYILSIIGELIFVRTRRLINNKIEAKHVYYIVMFIAYIYLIFIGCCHYIRSNEIGECKLELILIICFSAILYFSDMIKLDVFLKRKKKTKNIKTTKTEIRKRNILDSIFMSLVLTTLFYLLFACETVYIDFYSIFPNHLILSVIGFAVIIFLVSFIIIYLLLRFIIRKN